MSMQNDWINTEETMQEEKYPLSFEDFKKGLKAVVLDALANLSPNASSIDLRNGKFDFPMPITDKDYMEIYKEVRDSFHTLQANGEDFLDVYENYKEENRAEYVGRFYLF